MNRDRGVQETLFATRDEIEHFFVESFGKQFTGPRPIVETEKTFFTWNEINEVLSTHMFSGSACQIVKDRRYADVTYISSSTQTLNLAAVQAMLLDGGTLILNNVEVYSRRVRSLSEELEGLALAAVHVNMYATWGQSEAFGLHCDDQDTIICQIDGEKRWTVWAPGEMVPGNAKPTGKPIYDGDISAGQWMHVPKGWWHLVRGNGQISMHLTIGVSRYLINDLLVWRLTSSRATEDTRITDYLQKEGHVSSYLDDIAGSITPEEIASFIESRRRIRGELPNFNLPSLRSNIGRDE